jgi:O-antigen/teichoic acid export membrane protein
MARQLGPSEFGVYGLLLWWAVFAQTLINGGVTLGAIRFIAEERARDNPAQARSVAAHLARVQSVKLGIVLMLMVAILPWWIDRILPGATHLALALLFAAIGFRTSYMFYVSVAKGAERFMAVARIALIVAPVNLALVAFVAWWHPTVEAFVGVFLLTAIMFFLVSRWQVSDLLSGDRRALTESLRERIRHHLGIVSTNAIIRFVASRELELLLLGLWFSTQDAGYFKAGLTVAAGLILLVPGTFSAVLLPFMARAVTGGREVAGRRFRLATQYLVLLAIPLAAYVATEADDIIALLYGDAFAPAWLALATGIIGASFVSVGDAAQSYLLSAQRQWMLLVFTITGLVLRLVIGVLLIREFGLLGACISQVAVSGVLQTLKMTYAARELGVTLPLLHGLKVLAGGLCAAGAAWFASHGTPSVPGLIASAIVFVAVFAFATLLLRCYSLRDVEAVESLARRLPGPLRATTAGLARLVRSRGLYCKSTGDA